MSPLHSFLAFAGVLFSSTYAYVDFGSLTLPVEPLYEPTPRPNQLPQDYDLRHEILPSMITAVAPQVTLVANGTHETMYSLHYHHYFSKTRQGRGVFDKRGVFAGDPPIATCTPCGGDAATSAPVSTSTSNVPCTTRTYHGVFDYPPDSVVSACYNTNYTGVFQPTALTSTGLPCCFTIPASCRLNSTLSTTTTGSGSSLFSSIPYTSPSGSATTTSYSIIVISSTTITLTPSTTTTSNSGSGGVSDLPTLTVITGTVSATSSVSASVSLSTSTKSNTIIGCGQASGSGIIEGTGTVYLADTSVSASGTASGYATSVSGCGTIVATTGSFSGIASITGCGFGYGTGTLTGMGTVWPWYGGGLLSFVSSGTVAGAGSFVGCGTITGSGYFSATAGSPVLVTPSSTARPTRTISIYLSYCPDPTAGAGADSMFRLASSYNTTQGISPAIPSLNDTSPYTNSNANSTFALNSTIDTNPLCQVCPNSVGVCCPPTVSCSADDGKCPLFALENSGNMINGYLIQQVVNSSAPVAGRRKVRALDKKNVHDLGIGTDLVRLEMEVEQGLKKHKNKDKHRRTHHKHF
ncbi:hypothetical protein G647_08617 [Cladophialophora carrionii CBS 160.54]|uniref:4Fe-4S ferredoxin-type domain-containing protein n=1 Tax=Cladophialophora carrionii CBS 160.54 TaxID=1279043 RepID=V9D0X2_9EURO|nr:uncharacterized protein G647_08617 [Cladophialophora carrionii CBS 160.54]ETI20579.1 hypothetical protein G647_08617 [Cladophialophora carrionii CBS 160.54]